MFTANRPVISFTLIYLLALMKPKMQKYANNYILFHDVLALLFGSYTKKIHTA